jgi:hypothetical protein
MKPTHLAPSRLRWTNYVATILLDASNYIRSCEKYQDTLTYIILRAETLQSIDLVNMTLLHVGVDTSYNKG